MNRLCITFLLLAVLILVENSNAKFGIRRFGGRSRSGWGRTNIRQRPTHITRPIGWAVSGTSSRHRSWIPNHPRNIPRVTLTKKPVHLDKRFHESRHHQGRLNEGVIHKKQTTSQSNKPSAPPAEIPILQPTNVKPVGWAVPVEKAAGASVNQPTNVKPVGWAIPGEKPIDSRTPQSSNTRPIGWAGPHAAVSATSEKTPAFSHVPHGNQMPPGGSVPRSASNLGYGQSHAGFGSTGNHGFPSSNYNSHVNYGPITYMQGSGYNPYHHSSGGYGSGIFGLFVGYALGSFLTPSYYSPFHSTYPSHYIVHHYYHNKESVPQVVYLAPNAIVNCAANATVLCSSNTVALCLANGTIMCVAKAQETEPCGNDPKVNCIKTEVPCINKTLPGCEEKNVTTISLPCVSQTTLGSSSYVNSSLVTSTYGNATILPSNGTMSSNVPNWNLSQGASTDFCITLIIEPAINRKT